MTATASRVSAAVALQRRLENGWPKHSHGHGNQRLAWVSPKVHFVGDNSNVSVHTKDAIKEGDVIVAVAKSAALHARSELLSEERRTSAARRADLFRQAGKWQTTLVDADDPGKLESLLVLMQEVLDGELSAWWPYLQTVPPASECALPSLWSEILGDELASVPLESTSVGAAIQADLQDLRSLRSGIDFPGVFGVDENVAWTAFLHSVALASTRIVAGVGMVPLFDLMNGAPSGSHNAAIRFFALPGTDDIPCVAAVATTPIQAGEEILLEYGQLSSANFLYSYGYVSCDPAYLKRDFVSLSLAPIWAALTDLQRRALAVAELTQRALDSSVIRPKNDMFALPLYNGKPTLSGSWLSVPLPLRQLGFVACSDDDALREAIANGKLDVPVASHAQVAGLLAEWCEARSRELAVTCTASATSSRLQMAARVRECERQGLLAWAEALREQGHSSTIDAGYASEARFARTRKLTAFLMIS
eukprot:TRINITY_DN17609_c0_g1_i1.p1 TRINITY_DN17609_c0_g1~~TRINITY_DN17609_c0_g1_i1.p1  ORF type:complete len:477 (+),score=73.42 TRINITY_DN17609_c0_g1_i1:51-1481(+)